MSGLTKGGGGVWSKEGCLARRGFLVRGSSYSATNHTKKPQCNYNHLKITELAEHLKFIKYLCKIRRMILIRGG